MFEKSEKDKGKEDKPSFQNIITKMLGVKYPIVGGTMMWISTPEFVSSISNAGGLGVLASAMYGSREALSRAIDRVYDLTDKPFAVNLNFFPAKRPVSNADFLDIIIERGVQIVETSGHNAPEEMCARFKQAGLLWMHKCVGVRYAVKVQSMGVDIVTVVGYENGGATGRLDIGSLVLIPRVVESVGVPVIGGGGVADGRGFLAVLSLGAEGVIMGTRLLMTQEAPIHPNLKKALIRASELDTVLVLRSIGSTHRVWTNAAAVKCAEREAAHADSSEIIDIAAGEKARRMYDCGDLNVGIISCGQGVGMAHDIPTVKELFDRMMEQATGRYKEIGSGWNR